jgi:pimeloyl-ACP methyl ester carboxylesterase
VYVAPVDGGKGARRFVAFMGMGQRAHDGLLERHERRFGRPLDDYTAPMLAPRISAPLLVLHDEADPVVPFADGLGLADWAPHASLVRVQGLGHMRILRDPTVVAQIVRHITD